MKNNTKNANAPVSNAPSLNTAVKDGPVKMGSVKKVAGDDHGLRLAALKDLKEIKLNQIPDVRGWNAVLRDGLVLGKISRILVDQQQAYAPRYLDITVDAAHLKGMKLVSHDFLVPIGRAQAAESGDIVMLPSLTKEQIKSLPMLKPGSIGFEFESTVAKFFGWKSEVRDANALYETELFSVKDFMVLRPAVK